MCEIFLPTLHTFAMENVFTGSSGQLRFKITPNITKMGKEVDFDNSSMFVEYWKGLFCYEKSEILGNETFPLSEEGRMNLQQWLQDKI
ncbi:MAG: hypothetical protein IKW10_01875 [Oscillospiraceae bacterium]|nr:hypothetical protein [Oscillospiraceae bacterium]